MALRADDVDLGRDSLLVARFQAGDPDAFDDLYRRYFGRLRRFCQRRVGDANEAEELAQEAFVRALRAMPTLAGERRFYPWMTVIASRLCVDAHRRRGRSQPVAEVDTGAVDADLSGPDNEVDRVHLSEALGRVAPRHREVLELRELDGWSYQRIADHYGVTLGTVEALLHRARRALRREFLAVAGDTPAWAALPFAGILARRLASTRARLANLGGEVAQYATPFAGAVASVAIAFGTVAALDNPANARGSLTAAPSAVRAAHAPEVASPVLDVVAPAATAAAPITATVDPLESTVDVQPVAALGGIALGRHYTQKRTQESEVFGQIKLHKLEVLSVGLNPTTILTDVGHIAAYPGVLVSELIRKRQP